MSLKRKQKRRKKRNVKFNNLLMLDMHLITNQRNLKMKILRNHIIHLRSL